MATGWQVTNQRQTTVSDGLTYVPAMIVSFVTEGGYYGSVTLTKNQYNTDKAPGIIQAAADQIDTLGTLSSGTVDDTSSLG